MQENIASVESNATSKSEEMIKVINQLKADNQAHSREIIDLREHVDEL